MVNGRGGQGEITDNTVYAPMGFDIPEQAALQRLKEVYVDSGSDVQLALQDLGVPEDFGGTDLEKGQSLLMARSRTWVSRTPFLPTRHPKATRAGVPKVGFYRFSDRQSCARAAAAAGAGGLSRA